MTAVYFDGENNFKEAYQRYGLKDVLKNIDRELEDIQALIFTTGEALERQSMTPNERRVVEMAGNMTCELQDKIRNMVEYLFSTGLPVVLEVKHGH